MKKLFFILVMSLNFSTWAQQDCDHRVLAHNKGLIVVPVYSSKTLYYFDDQAKKAMAHVQWAFEPDLTSECFRTLEARFTGYNLQVAGLNVPELEVQVFGGQKSAKLIIYPQPGSQFHGQTDLIPVNYRLKQEILKALAEKRDLIKMSGNFQYEYNYQEPGVVGHLSCTDGQEVSGVFALHKRLGEVIKLLDKRAPAEKVNRSSVLELFMGECVEVQELVTSSSLSELARKVSRKVKVVNGKIPVEGMVEKSARADVAPFKVFENTYIEY